MRDIGFPEETLKNWQAIVDLIVRISGVKVGLIMEVVDDDIAVLVSSNTNDNPYHVGDREHLHRSGLYCETVIRQGKHLMVPDAIKDSAWNKNPDLKHGLVSYLGFPIRLPDRRILGTLCVLDDKENHYSADIMSLMSRMKELIESQLELLAENRHHRIFAKTSLLRQILDSLPVAIACCSLSSDSPLYLNQQFSTMLGYTLSDIGSLIHVLQSDQGNDDATRISTQAWMQTLTSLQEHPGQSVRRESRLRCSNGTWIEALIDTVVIKDLLVVSVVDISARKRDEHELRKREEHLDMVLSATGLGTWSWNIPDGMVYLDKRAIGLCGRSLVCEKLSLQDLQSDIHPEDRDAVISIVQQHLDAETSIYEAEYRRRHADGHWIWMLDRGKVVVRDAEGRPLQMTGTYHDITYRKRLESESAILMRQITSLLNNAIQQTGQRDGSLETGTFRNFAKLTRRQKEILRLVASGLSSVEISKQLNISRDTVNTHRRDLMQKLNIRSVAGLTKIAIQENLL